jgi:amino acid transporter
MERTRLGKIIALPIFASDAISSSAYATQEILLVLGLSGLWLTHPHLYRDIPFKIALAIAALLWVVVVSYWQTIFAYPSGGGSYIVSRANLGATFGLIAAAALLTDYVLTVAVSVASGVQNLLGTPILQSLQSHQTLVCALVIAVICLANLRGLRESGMVFALPTYLFIGTAVLMIALGLVGPQFGWGLRRDAVTRSLPVGSYQVVPQLTDWLLIVIVLKAFASGCSAMTGTEAVSNGIPAFKRPESRNAALTLLAMAVILSSLLIGFTALAVRLGIVYGHHGSYTSPAVVDQLSRAVFGRGSALYYLMQFATGAILVLGADTSFADFPRLSAILSKDRYLPRQLRNQGDKLVYSNGIVLLAVLAIGLIVAFRGSVDRLIPLYAVGVFTAFTLSQAGMVRHWFVERGPWWGLKSAINGFGAVCTGVVLTIIAVEKFQEGAWMAVFLVALLVWVFQRIHSHYMFVSSRLSIIGHPPSRTPKKNVVLLLVPSLHRGVYPALDYVRGLTADCRAIHIEIDPEETERLRREWEANVGEEIPLVILPSPYRSLVGPLLEYIDEVRAEGDNQLVTVVLPEFVSTKWWHALLHNANGPLLKLYLAQRPGVVLTNVRYFLSEYENEEGKAAEAAPAMAGVDAKPPLGSARPTG